MTVVNLNTARKAKDRATARAKADENAMKHGRTKAERTLQQDLARRVVGQVLAAHDVGDALLGIVDHHRELVGPQAVGAPQHEVTDLVRHVLALWAEAPVNPINGQGN